MAELTPHISEGGFEHDDHGFIVVNCGCGFVLGPAPDEETALDMAMEHAFHEGRQTVLKEWHDA
jgi:hypothetical protein